ncbi:MAG: alkaline phosphatase D family protein [Prolixibacteraceae bacterium]|nr:alkaline phosphatase D family protein [Prolixibacteraceae bacterium]
MKYIGIITIFLLVFNSCSREVEYEVAFDNINDRIWPGRNFWSVPLEDWKIEDGKLFCIGDVPHSRVNLLTHVLKSDAGDFKISVELGLTDRGDEPGSAGLLLGLYDDEDADVRAACYFGEGIAAGVSLQGFVFLKDQRVELPGKFDFSEFIITVNGNNNAVRMKVTDKNGNSPEELSCSIDGIEGLVALANNISIGENVKPGSSKFSFDKLHLSGSKVVSQPENSFGPILWAMHTLSNNTLKLMAFLPPIGISDNQQVSLQIKENELWQTVSTETIESDSRTALFKLANWDSSEDKEYRIEYIEKGKDGREIPDYFTGTVRRDPVERSLKFGGMTCQFTSGYPYTPLVENLEKLDPDILYFSGDQVYEPNGGYPIKREPVDVSIVNYLGKYYMFGWAFRDLMRDRPTICTPDDHDVYHGNLWGEAGEDMAEDARMGSSPGFKQSVKMVNAVNRTHCGQLPDPYDPAPIKRGMSVWYTNLTYGRISFAIISDRIFKTGPTAVADWEGRADHMKEPREDLSFLDKPGIEMIGERQMKFLNDWILDWKDVDMKVLLSQTVFANVATHHGGLEEYLYGDLDSGGWPKSGRDEVIKLMRKVAAFHINGDQHIPSLVQYGLENYRDAGWSFCTPAICNYYVRWFLPDELDVEIIDRPEHGYPNTGKYVDAFGNKNYVYAIGNPGKITVDQNSRYNNAQIRSSGFGMVTFDKDERTIAIDSWRFKADVENPNPVRDQFPGWPLTISQFDNLGHGAENILPEIQVNKPDQLIQVWNERTGELVQIYRIKGDIVQPQLHESGIYTVKMGEGSNIKEISGLRTQKNENSLVVSMDLP